MLKEKQRYSIKKTYGPIIDDIIVDLSVKN